MNSAPVVALLTIFAFLALGGPVLAGKEAVQQPAQPGMTKPPSGSAGTSLYNCSSESKTCTCHSRADCQKLLDSGQCGGHLSTSTDGEGRVAGSCIWR